MKGFALEVMFNKSITTMCFYNEINVHKTNLTSDGVSQYSLILSTETIFVSKSVDVRTIQLSAPVTYKCINRLVWKIAQEIEPRHDKL